MPLEMSPHFPKYGDVNYIIAIEIIVKFSR